MAAQLSQASFDPTTGYESSNHNDNRKLHGKGVSLGGAFGLFALLMIVWFCIRVWAEYRKRRFLVQHLEARRVGVAGYRTSDSEVLPVLEEDGRPPPAYHGGRERVG